MVEVTEDHSLLDQNSNKITPTDLTIGSKLLTSKLPLLYSTKSDISLYRSTNLGMSFQNIEHKILDELLNSSEITRRAFIDGLLSENPIYICSDNKLKLASLFHLTTCLGYNATINTTEDGNIFRLTYSKSKLVEHEDIVKQINLLHTNYNGFVYDLETDNHHFSAGIGQIIVHNTDSNYVSFPHLNTAAECWDHATHVAKEVSKLFRKPMELAYENKVYMRFMILTKKRYMSLACERDGKMDNKISKKGVLLQRRDTCDFVRKVYGDVVMMIFNKQDRDDILYYIITELNKLSASFYPVTDFIVTKSVGNMGFYEDSDIPDSDPEPLESKNDKGKQCWKIGDYTIKLIPTDPKKRESQFTLKNCNTVSDYYLHCFPAQAQLAYKMRSRGQLVAAGSRIEYVITTTGGHLAKQYLKVESSEYFIRHRTALDIDYLYYLKQLSNPLDQVLDVMYNKDDGNKFKFSPHFMLQQYKYRYQVREKMINELKSIFTPQIKFN
jgi:hypothetical protein